MKYNKFTLFITLLLLSIVKAQSDETSKEFVKLTPGPIKGDYSKKDLDATYDEKSVDIQCSGVSCVSSDENVLTTEGKVTISTAGTYVLQGELNGQLYIAAGKDDFIHLVLRNMTITSEYGPALLEEKCKKIVITSVGENFLTDSANYPQSETNENGENENEEDTKKPANACLFAKDNLTFNGNGSITVTANYDEAIRCKDSLKFVSGDINVISKGKAIKAKDSISVKEANINIDSVDSAMKVTKDDDPNKGFIVVDGGKIIIKTTNDGIHAESHFTVNDGFIDIVESNEGIEGQMIDITGGEVHVNAINDGINSSRMGSKGGDFPPPPGGFGQFNQSDFQQPPPGGFGQFNQNDFQQPTQGGFGQFNQSDIPPQGFDQQDPRSPLPSDNSEPINPEPENPIPVNPEPENQEPEDSEQEVKPQKKTVKKYKCRFKVLKTSKASVTKTIYKTSTIVDEPTPTEVSIVDDQQNQEIPTDIPQNMPPQGGMNGVPSQGMPPQGGMNGNPQQGMPPQGGMNGGPPALPPKNYDYDDEIYIRITGGKVYVRVDGNDTDGLDSNGSLYIGGDATVFVAHEQGDIYGNMASLDSEGSNIIDVGTTAVITASGKMPPPPGSPGGPPATKNMPAPPPGGFGGQGFGMPGDMGGIKGGPGGPGGMGGPPQMESGTVKQANVQTKINIQEAGVELVLKDSEGNVIISHKPEASYSQILITSPKLVEGKEYTIIAGDVIKSVTATVSSE